MVDLFVTPSIIHAYTLKPEWGVRAYYNTLTGNREPLNYFIRRGLYLHRKLGYNNNVRFYRTVVINCNGGEKVLAVEGTPDHIEPLKELKTCHPDKLNDPSFERSVDAGALQLQGYMFLTGYECGYLVFADRNTGNELLEITVPRNDRRFLNTVLEFFDYINRIPRLDEYLKRE